jgi:hypothetical protein
LNHFLTDPLRLAESDVELNVLKGMVDNMVAFFYSCESSSKAHATHMLDSLATRSREIILANMRQTASPTLRILMSLNRRVDLDAAGEGFAVTYSDDEALKLIEDSAVMVEHVIGMLGVDMSLG